MKQGVLAVLVVIATMAFGQAQDNPRAERFQKNAAEMDEFFEEIGVTDAQMKEIKEARAEMGKSLNECRGQGRSEETRKKMNSIHEDYAKQLKGILNADQFSQWEKHVENRPKRRHHNGKRPE